MEILYICKKCKKPDPKQVRGKARSGRKLLRALEQEDLNLKVVPCKCLGNCRKGPNALAMPGRERLHRLSLKKVRKLSAKQTG